MFTSPTPHPSPQGLRRAFRTLVCTAALLSVLVLALQPAPALAGTDGAISGTVTFTGGGPVFNVSVVAYEVGGSESGSDLTDASGNYQVNGLPAGNYVLEVMAGNSGAVGEIYDDIACPLPPCDEQTGDPVAVAASTTTTGIDFVLDRVARIRGTVTEDGSGLPIEGVEVQAVSQATGTTFDTTFTNASGGYLLEYPENQNTLVWAGGSPYAGEMYDDVPCEKDSPWTCNLATPDLLAFTLNSDLNDIDLALDEFGSISGNVTRAVGGTAFEGRTIRAWDSNGDLVDSDVTDVSGDYTIEALPPGNYYIGYVQASNYLGELYDGVFCEFEMSSEVTCDTGAATLVASTLNTDTTGIDLALDRGAVVLGNVALTEGSSAPVNSRTIRIYDTNNDEVARKSIGFDGDYSFVNLFPGTYYLVTDGYPTFLDEAYDDVPCAEGVPTDCDPTDGQALVLSAAQQVPDVDFTVYPNLDGFGGKVRRDTDSFKLEGIQIDLWDALGNLLDSVNTAADGSYFFELAADTYYVSTTTGSYVNEVFSNMPCPLGPASNGDCDPTAGTPIGVTFGSGPILGVDFDLTPTAMIFADGFESGNTTAWSNTVN